MTAFSDFNPEWTADQAFEAGAEGPRSPFHRWAAWHSIHECRASYDAGRNASLFAALRLCACHDLPMPDWVADAYVRGYYRWQSYDSPSLDEAFGVQPPKGAHVERLRKYSKLWLAVPLKVRELQRQGRAVDETMFRDVGLALNVSGSTARDIYYKSAYRKHLQKNR